MKWFTNMNNLKTFCNGLILNYNYVYNDCNHLWRINKKNILIYIVKLNLDGNIKNGQEFDS